jgi:hypothetical protein
MVPEFEKLDSKEVDLMLKAPILVCILIAGADGEIDSREIRRAISVTGKKAKSNTILWQYFKIAFEDFEDKIRILLQSYPSDPFARNEILSTELSGLNDVFPKINRSFDKEFYALLKELASEVAESSGGLLGYKSVGDEEARYVGLGMILPPA